MPGYDLCAGASLLDGPVHASLMPDSTANTAQEMGLGVQESPWRVDSLVWLAVDHDRSDENKHPR